METPKLLLNCAFFKEAALLKVPDQILKPVEDWALGAYCLVLRTTLKNKLNELAKKNLYLKTIISQNFKQLIAVCNSHIKSRFLTAKIFSFPIAYFPYLKQISRAKNIDTVEFSATFHNQNSEEPTPNKTEPWAGLWTEDPEYGNQVIFLGKLFISREVEKDANILIFNLRLGNTLDILDAFFRDIRITVRHEMQHITQSFLSHAIGKRSGGLPGRKIQEPGFDPYGMPATQQMYGRLEHSLRDMEFYTDLSDSVALFKQNVNKVPLRLQKGFLLIWTAQIPTLPEWKIADVRAILNRLEMPVNADQIGMVQKALMMANNGRKFFQALKQMNPGKYKKAIKEFYKSVGK